MRRVVIIGSTGSVGRNTLNVIEHLGERFQVVGLAARSSTSKLAAQVARHAPLKVALADPSMGPQFERDCAAGGVAVGEVLLGAAGVRQIAAMEEADVVVAAAVGAAGLEPIHAALEAGKTVALANKEAMVIAGELLQSTARAHGGTILPVDSEHNAIHQCLRAGTDREVRRLILTASGGPFLDRAVEDFDAVTPEEALAHPVWKMGRRITIDSATLMNKGLEVIEARWLFGMYPSEIDILVHPQSVVHSMVEFVDGSVVAQLGAADMRGPIQYALTYPDRLESAVPLLDWTTLPPLEFREPDHDRFPAIGLAYRALEMGGTAPAVLNAADEVAVGAFLERRVSFCEIPRIIAAVLDAHPGRQAADLEAVIAADRWARAAAADATLHIGG